MVLLIFQADLFIYYVDERTKKKSVYGIIIKDSYSYLKF